MTAVASARAYRHATLLRYAAIQFVALVAIAMVLYPGGTWSDPSAPHYELAHNFLSDLGATRTFSGASNTASLLLFAIALATIGGALVAFSWTWRAFAFARGRARGAGIASALFGTASGAAFAAVAFTPVNVSLQLHNTFVVTAFAMLFAYAACLAVVMAKNGVGRIVLDGAYVALVCGYFVFGLFGPRPDTDRGFAMQVIAQKVVAVASMMFVALLTTRVRRAVRRVQSP